MKRRRLLLILFGCITSIVFAFLLWPREREPEYKRVSLTVWVMRCGNIRDTEALDAVKHIGTNSLPFLIRWIQYERPRWKTWLYNTGPKLPAAIRNSRFMRWLLADNAAVRANGTTKAFACLGSDAECALPELQQIANNVKAIEPSNRARIATIFITGRMPPDGFQTDLWR